MLALCVKGSRRTSVLLGKRDRLLAHRQMLGLLKVERTWLTTLLAHLRACLLTNLLTVLSNSLTNVSRLLAQGASGDPRAVAQRRRPPEHALHEQPFPRAGGEILS